VQVLGLVTLVGLVTITASTYMILYSQPLFERLRPALRVFERRTPFRELAEEGRTDDETPVDVIIFGQGRYGARLLRQLRDAGVHAIGVDFDPEAVRALRKDGLPVQFGDGEDADFVHTLPLAQASWIVTTFPQWESNRALLHALQEAGYRGAIAGAVRDARHGKALADAGLQRVLNPFEDAADHAAQTLAELIRQPPTPGGQTA
jgi:voltage-gated potassium channel Kch